jgi:hypothetical protein
VVDAEINIHYKRVAGLVRSILLFRYIPSADYSCSLNADR